MFLRSAASLSSELETYTHRERERGEWSITRQVVGIINSIVFTLVGTSGHAVVPLECFKVAWLSIISRSRFEKKAPYKHQPRRQTYTLGVSTRDVTSHFLSQPSQPYVFTLSRACICSGSRLKSQKPPCLQVPEIVCRWCLTRI